MYFHNCILQTVPTPTLDEAKAYCWFYDGYANASGGEMSGKRNVLYWWYDLPGLISIVG